jgi:hypothetical protein
VDVATIQAGAATGVVQTQSNAQIEIAKIQAQTAIELAKIQAEAAKARPAVVKPVVVQKAVKPDCGCPSPK